MSSFVHLGNWRVWRVLLTKKRVIQPNYSPENLLELLNGYFSDECCLLPSEVQIPNYNPYVPCKNYGISSNLLFSRSHPLSLEFGKYPIKSSSSADSNGSNWMDGLRLLWLGKNPTGIKVCNRCGCCTLTHLPPRSAANKAWDQRWLRGCPCGGNWKIPSYLPQPKAVDPDNFLNF